jgi:hypothetical protein
VTRLALVALVVMALADTGCGHYDSPIRPEAITSERGRVYDAGQPIQPDQPPRRRRAAPTTPTPPPIDPLEPYDPSHPDRDTLP